MWAIYKKELQVYFNSILGYIIMFLFIGIASIVFLLGYIYPEGSVGDFSNLFSTMNIIMLFIMPLLTVRLLADEKKDGSYELLLTSPVSSWEIILSKFLAVLSFAMIGASIIMLFPIAYAFVGDVQWEPLISSFLGMVLSFSFFFAIGMAASSMSGNYVVAALISYGFVAVIFLIPILGNTMRGIAADIFIQAAFTHHYEKLSTGIFEIKNILYFIFGTFIWLFLAKNVVESKTWK